MRGNTSKTLKSGTIYFYFMEIRAYIKDFRNTCPMESIFICEAQEFHASRIMRKLIGRGCIFAECKIFIRPPSPQSNRLCYEYRINSIPYCIILLREIGFDRAKSGGTLFQY